MANGSVDSLVNESIDLKRYAGFWRRTLATLIDTAIILILMKVLSLLFFDGQMMVIETDNNQNFSLKSSFTSSINWMQELILVVITIVLWMKFLGTPGKLILGCQVVDAKTFTAMNPGQAVLRYVAYIISMVPMMLGFFWIAWDKRKQGFHDKIAGTVVILKDVESSREKDDESQKSLNQLMDELR